MANQYFVCILSPVTDNCPSWISRRKINADFITWSMTISTKVKNVCGWMGLFSLKKKTKKKKKKKHCLCSRDYQYHFKGQKVFWMICARPTEKLCLVNVGSDDKITWASSRSDLDQGPGCPLIYTAQCTDEQKMPSKAQRNATAQNKVITRDNLWWVVRGWRQWEITVVTYYFLDR